MAKLQIFVLIVALSQAYGSVIEMNTLPASLSVVKPVVRPDSIVVVPDIVAPPCVATIRALFQAILDRLPNVEAVEVPRPLPIPVPQPEVEQVPEVAETPCSACFEHINSLLTNAEKVIAIRKMSAMMRRH